MIKRKHKGYTFIEVLISLAFLIVIFVPAIRLLNYVTVGTSEVVDKIRAINLARADIEELRGWGLHAYDDNPADDPDGTEDCLNEYIINNPNPYGGNNSISIDGIAYDLRRTCQAYDPGGIGAANMYPDLLWITIRVYLRSQRQVPATWGTWTGRGGNPLITLETLYDIPLK